MANTITRAHASDLKRFTGVTGASNVLFVAVPRCEGSPWAEDALYMGNYDPNTPYWCLSDAALLMSTIVADTDEGGFLLKVDESQPDLYAKVKKAVAAKGLYPFGSPEEGARKALEARYAYKSTFFSPKLSEEIEVERAKIKERQRAGAAQKENVAQKRQALANAAYCRSTTVVLCGAARLGERGQLSDEQHFFPDLEHDGLTDEQREARDAAAQLLEQDEIDRGAIRADELADVGQRAAGNVASKVQPKWIVAGIAVPRAEKADPALEEGLLDGDRTRSAFHESMGIEYNEGRSQEDKYMGMIMVFIQMDPEINAGRAQAKILEIAAARRKFERDVSSGTASTYGRRGRGVGDGPAAYSPDRDPYISLRPYRSKKHPVFAAGKESVADMAAQLAMMRVDEEWRNNAIYSTSAHDRAAPIHPDKWGSPEYAIRWMEKLGGDCNRLQMEDLFEGYAERRAAGSRTPIRNELGLIDMKMPMLPRRLGEGGGQAQPVHLAWQWTHESRAQVRDSLHEQGLLDQYFPFVSGGVVDGEGLMFGAECENSRGEEEQASVDPANIFHDDPMQAKALAKRQGKLDYTDYGAPYDTCGDTHQDNFYMMQRVTQETLTHFVHRDHDRVGYTEIFMPAQRLQEQKAWPVFKEAMGPDARTNQYAKAMIMWGEKMKKTTKTLTLPLWLHDCGDPADPQDPYGPRDPERPALDTFAHMVIKHSMLLRSIKGVENPPLVWFAQKATSMCFHFRPGKLHPLLVISAPAGQGKTYVIKVVMSLSVPNTYRNENHLSNMAQTASNDVDVAILTDEGGGILQHKKFADRKATEINKSTINGVGMIAARRAEFITDEYGNKKMGVADTSVMHQKAYLVGTNLKYEELVEEMAARCWFFNKREAFLPATSLTWDNIASMSDGIKNWNRVLHYCKASIYKAIQMGYIPDITSVPTLDLVLIGMTHMLEQLGVTMDENNNVNRVHEKIREACIDDMVTYAVATAIHMPGGVCYQDDWELTLWKRVSPLLYCTLQIMLWNIIGLKREWTGDSLLLAEIVRAALLIGNYSVEAGKTPSDAYRLDTEGKIMWRTRKRYDKATVRPPRAGEQAEAGGEGDGRRFGNRPDFEAKDTIDLNYISIPWTKATAQQISKNMPDPVRLSPGWITALLKRSASSAVFKPPRYPYTPKTEEELKALANQVTTGRRVGENAEDRAHMPVFPQAERDISQTSSIPIVEISEGKYDKSRGRLYISTEAVPMLEKFDLKFAFLWSVMSSKFRPQRFIVPDTHPEHHDIMDVVNVTASFRDRMVDTIDNTTIAKYNSRAQEEYEYRAQEASRVGLPIGPFEPPASLETITVVADDRTPAVVATAARPPPQVISGGSGAAQALLLSAAAMDEDDDEEEEDNDGDGDRNEETPPLKKYVHTTVALTGNWEEDSVYLSRRNGVSKINHQYMSPAERIMILGAELDYAHREDWEAERAKVMANRSALITTYGIDLNYYAAYERHVRCGLPFKSPDGKKIPVQDWAESERNFLAYVGGKNPSGQPIPYKTFRYPEDMEESREGNILAFDHLYGELRNSAQDAAEGAAAQAMERDMEAFRNMSSSFVRTKRSRAVRHRGAVEQTEWELAQQAHLNGERYQAPAQRQQRQNLAPVFNMPVAASSSSSTARQ